MTGPQVCSLIRRTPQRVPEGEYATVRFPFGPGDDDETGESYDGHAMHDPVQPDEVRVRSWEGDDRSGLIWPSASGWAVVTGMAYWRHDGGVREFRDRFVRDPLALSTWGPDSTATQHHAPSAGRLSCYHATHFMYLRRGVPLAFRVGWEGSRSSDVELVHAQFKVGIWPDG